MLDPSLQQKLAYLNVPFFLVRTGLYFTIWLGLAWRLRAWSLAQDTTADPSLSRRMETLSGPGLVLWVATLSLASIDWVMSLDPHWYSTAYGLLFMLGHVLNTLALVSDRYTTVDR